MHAERCPVTVPVRVAGPAGAMAPALCGVPGTVSVMSTPAADRTAATAVSASAIFCRRRRRRARASAISACSAAMFWAGGIAVVPGGW